MDPKLTVARGYDRIAEGMAGLRRQSPPSGRKRSYLQRLTAGLPGGALVLDLGCGPGEEAAWLSERYRVVAADLSRTQLALARRNAPKATLLRTEMGSLPFRDGAFAAIAMIYSIIHVPKEEHEPIVERLYALLLPGGRLFAVFGSRAWEGREENWLELGAEMYWSHFGGDDYLRMLERAGFRVDYSQVEPDELTGVGAHLFVLAEKPA